MIQMILPSRPVTPASSLKHDPGDRDICVDGGFTQIE